MGEEILGHAVWINFEIKLDVTSDSVEYFVGCFPSILGDINPGRDNLNKQFLQYKFTSINDLPENLRRHATITMMIILVELTLFGVTCAQLINQELKYHNLTFCFELHNHTTFQCKCRKDIFIHFQM